MLEQSREKKKTKANEDFNFQAHFKHRFFLKKKCFFLFSSIPEVDQHFKTTEKIDLFVVFSQPFGNQNENITTTFKTYIFSFLFRVILWISGMVNYILLR